MHSEFEMSMMGELNFFLGLQIKQPKKGTFINQAKYIRDLLKRFNMEEAKTMKTPMSLSIKLDKDEKGTSIDSTMYRGMIRFLLYLTASRPDIMYSRLGFGSRLTSPPSVRHSQGFLLSRAPRVSGVCASLSTSLVSFVFAFFMASRRESTASRAQGKHPTESSQPAQTEACQKARFDTTLFSTMEIIRDAQGMGKPSAYSPTVISRVLHHMICSIMLPRGGHRDEVSYLEAFLIDSIMTGRRIHVEYLMMMHMISCCESTSRVLPYNCFLTRMFKDVEVDLSRETDFEAPSIYDTCDE
ncbi:Retrovirus-related Pol polyprotein from transposon RE1 [Vitis vinifera]|uniref:Retrovirus-related Pol polyprotein from transposon RE1 n=1 Tax=Vitis vinifera TaxID=29760 RepID=A0A438H390_VITVI|nr:Retrovirus-related Pol polyprotein from transposon RE1 [Vitis vinifera]